MLHLEIVIVREWLRQKCKVYVKDHVLQQFMLLNFDSSHVILSGMTRLSSTIFDMALEMMFEEDTPCMFGGSTCGGGVLLEDLFTF